MVLFNYATKELTAKIVYYGPGLCGKTTNLQFIHGNLPETVKGKMLSLATKTDRTLFFDFLPLDLGEIRGMKTRVQLYTVPGQVFYNETRKLVLKGVDGVVFVADSQKEMIDPNVESFKNLEENLKTHGVALAELPHLVQFNKRDLPKLASIEELNRAVNKYNAPFYESVATTGIGVKDTLNAITKLVLLHLTKKYGSGVATPEPQPVAVAAAAEAPARATRSRAPAAAGKGGSRSRETAPPPRVARPEPVAEEEAPAPRFEAAEIDDLIDEVQTARPPESDLPLGPPDDEPIMAAEPEPPVMPPVAAAPPAAPRPLAPEPAELTLTQVASDDDLFDDPNLEVARLAAGETREIVIPVEVGDTATGVRRYKLSVRLRLDTVS
jgi:hypothetical protein